MNPLIFHYLLDPFGCTHECFTIVTNANATLQFCLFNLRFYVFNLFHSRPKGITLSFDSFAVSFLNDTLGFPLSKLKKFNLYVQFHGQRFHCCSRCSCFRSQSHSEVPVCVRNLSTASNTRDFTYNIHVNNDQQLESLHDLMSQLEGKLHSLRSVVKIAHGFESLDLHHVITPYHLAMRTIEPKFTFMA